MALRVAARPLCIGVLNKGKSRGLFLAAAVRNSAKTSESQRPDAHDWSNMTSVAGEQLEEHREVRAFYRKAAWELPQLSEFAQTYVPPAATDVLNFRYTVHVGEEEHPADRKVVLTCKTKALGLTDAQLHKFRVLAGPRYRVSTDEFRMSSEVYGNVLQNKLHLCETLERLLAAAKDGKDEMADIPLDTRHMDRQQSQRKSPGKFPKEWRRPQDAPGHNDRTIAEK